MLRYSALLIIAFLSFAAVASAGTYTLGTTIDGYVFADDGYWYRGGQRYTHTAVYRPGCQVGCSYSPGYTTHSFELYQTAPAYQAPALPSYQDPGWRTQLLTIAANRDKYEAQIRKSQFEHQQYMEAVNGLGLSGNFRIQNYGAPAPYNYFPPLVNPYGTATIGSPTLGYAGGNQYVEGTLSYGAINGSSQYGQSGTYNQRAGDYGDVNVMQLYQMANQLALQQQGLSGQATSQFQGLVGQSGANQARLQELLIRGQVAQQVLAALQVGPLQENKQFTFKIGPGAAVQREDTNVQPELRTKLNGDFQALFTAQCASCHGGDKPAASFNLEKYLSMNIQDKQLRVWSRISPDAPEDKAMPKDHKRLDANAFRLFVLN